MNDFFTLLIRYKFITEKSIKGISVYFLPFALINILVSTIMGDLIFLAVRLLHLRVAFVQKNFLPVGIFLMFAIPIILTYIYAKNNVVELLRKQDSDIDIHHIKKLKTKATIVTFFIAFSPIISLSILSVLFKLNII